jgi:hypothetical protein
MGIDRDRVYNSLRTQYWTRPMQRPSHSPTEPKTRESIDANSRDDLDSLYRKLAADEEREAAALEWIDALCGDVLVAEDVE